MRWGDQSGGSGDPQEFIISPEMRETKVSGASAVSGSHG